MGITQQDIKEFRLKLCKMLDECQGCTKTAEPKTAQHDLCRTCFHWQKMQEQRMELEKLQKIYRSQRQAVLGQVSIL